MRPLGLTNCGDYVPPGNLPCPQLHLPPLPHPWRSVTIAYGRVTADLRGKTTLFSGKIFTCHPLVQNYMIAQRWAGAAGLTPRESPILGRRGRRRLPLLSDGSCRGRSHVPPRRGRDKWVIPEKPRDGRPFREKSSEGHSPPPFRVWWGRPRASRWGAFVHRRPAWRRGGRWVRSTSTVGRHPPTQAEGGVEGDLPGEGGEGDYQFPTSMWGRRVKSQRQSRDGGR